MKTDWKQSAVDRKDYRHTQVPEESFRQPTKNKRPRPFILESRWVPRGAMSWLTGIMRKGEGEWRKSGSYRTLAEAENALAQHQRKYSSFIEYRLKPEDPDETT